MADTKYFRIQLYGYGGESSYISVTKDAYDFWEDLADDVDSTLRNWMLDDESDFKVPDKANFLTEYGKDKDMAPWYGAMDEFEHSFGVELNSARVIINETGDTENDAEVLHELVDDEDLKEYLLSFEEDDDPADLIQYGEADTGEQYTVQFMSTEKGMFFDGFIESAEEYDAKKLKVTVFEYPNGEEIVTDIVYDGEEIENSGGDTVGKGYSAYIWKNEDSE
jgi:hypothetical protein